MRIGDSNRVQSHRDNSRRLIVEIIYRFEGQRYNLPVPHHRMVRLNMRENGRFETKLAEDISLHNHKVPVAGYTKGNRYREFTP